MLPARHWFNVAKATAAAKKKNAQKVGGETVWQNIFSALRATMLRENVRRRRASPAGWVDLMVLHAG
jgi:hypothetical protein